MTEGREAKRVAKERDKKAIDDVDAENTVPRSRGDATEVVFLPKDDAKAAFDALMAAINSEVPDGGDR